VTLTDAHTVAFSTGAGAGNVAFNSTLNGSADFAEDLSITAGTGSVTFTGAVGATFDLGDITIVSALDVTFLSTLAADSFTQSAGTGDTQFDGNVTINSSSSVNVAVTTNTVTVNAPITTLNGGTVTITNAGL
ncbi:MAG: hypothetical protein ACKPJJ_36265, partial [Planctomycetaceae bacterium]